MGAPGAAAADAELYRRVQRQITRLARGMVARFLEEVPLYRRLPQEQLEGEITRVTEDNLRIFFRTLREERDPTDDELAEPRLSAARRAEERVPLEAVLHAYHVGARVGWEALCEAAGPHEQADLVAAAARVLRYVQVVTGAVAAAYLDEQQAIYGEERDARRAYALALLSGDPAEGLAARLGRSVAPAYVVLVLRLGRHPDEEQPGVTASVAGRRKLRRLEARLAAVAGDDVLALLDPGGGAVLLPTTRDAAAALVEQVRRDLESATEAVGAGVTAGVAVCDDPARLPQVAEQAAEVLRLAVRLERGTGVHELRDLLLEYQLTRPSDALTLLAALLDPLERNPDLVVTLNTYLGNDLDRRRTASALHVHPNTLDYRLRRVVELTGLDPATATGLQLLGASLAARRTLTAQSESR